MSRVTTKLQVSIPKALAERCGIRPGDDVAWETAGDTLRLRTPLQRGHNLTAAERLRLFDAATARQAEREAAMDLGAATERNWRRDDLYDR